MDRITAAKVFVSIVEQQSLIGASNALGISRSMVSRYLATMEDWANARLLHRSTRSLSLTPAGEQVLNQCRQMLALAADVQSVNEHHLQNIVGTVRISCSQFFAEEVLPPLIQDFFAEQPNIAVELHVSNQAVDLVKERIDLAIRITNDLDPNLIARKLATCHSVLCAAPDYLATIEPPSQLADLERLNCLTYANFNQSLWYFNTADGVNSVVAKGNFSANESRVLLRAALAGMGIAVLPKHSVLPHLQNGELVELLPKLPPLALGVFGVYLSREHQSLALRSFLDFLLEKLPLVEM